MSARIALMSVLLLGCSSKSEPVVAPYPEDCTGLDEAKSFDCAELRFWEAFQQPKLEPRKRSEAMLDRVIAQHGGARDRVALSRMHFRLGQIRLSLALENDQRETMLKASELIVAPFDHAMAIDPSNGVIAPWKDTMEMALFAVLGDWGSAVPLAERGFANVEKNRLGNTLSLSGTTIGFPLSTGVPQKTIALLDAWTCTGPAFCERNTEHAPWARPGLAYHFAEAYARVGDREKTKLHLDRALAAPGAEAWPYRWVATSAANDLDAFLAKFAARGKDQGAFDIAYANQSWGCLFCHEKR